MADVLSMIDPELARLAGRGAARTQRQPDLTEEDQRSVVGKLRDRSLGTLAAAGNVLDLPGSSVRDVLAWKNPIDQWAPWNWTSSNNRTTGRDLARQYGAAGRRDTWGNAIGGFAAEVALDPLTYLTLGGAAIGKVGQAAKRAGLMDDIAGVSARKAGVAIGDIGKSQARTTTTLDDFLQYGNTAARAKAKSLIDEGFKADEAVGGLFGVGIPFREPSWVFTGAKAEKAAKAMDTAGSAVRRAEIPLSGGFKPVDSVARLFDATIHGTKTKFGQAVARTLHRTKEKGYHVPRLASAHRANQMKDVFGDKLDDYGDSLRDLVEGVVTPDEFRAANPDLSKDQLDTIQGIASDIGLDDGRMLSIERSIGVNVEELQDDYINHIRRSLVQQPGHKPKRDNQLLSGYINSSEGRIDEFRNVKGGTSAVKRIARDDVINAMIEADDSVEDIAKAIEARYGTAKGSVEQSLSEGYWKYSDTDSKWHWHKDGRFDAIAKRLKGYTKETREAGIYGNNPIIDHEARQLSHEDTVRSVETLADALSQPGIVSDAPSTSAAKRVEIGQLAKDANLKWGDDEEGFGQFLNYMLKASKHPNAGKKITELSKLTISAEHAEDLLKLAKTVQSPEAMDEILRFTDSITNLSKGLWTSAWPAFHVRNLVSGQFQNALSGMWDANSSLTAFNVLKARPTTGLKEMDFIQAIWASRGGLPPSGPASGGPITSPTPGGVGPEMAGTQVPSGGPFKYDKGHWVQGEDPRGLPKDHIAYDPPVTWVQDHSSLVRDAVNSWKGSPTDMGLHLQEMARGVNSNSSGSGKIMRAQAEALYREVVQNGKPAPTLYRGDLKDAKDNTSVLLGWTSDKETASKWAKTYGGKIHTLEGARGLEAEKIPGITRAFKENEWIVAHADAKQSGSGAASQDLWALPEGQNISSAGTSINASQLPATFSGKLPTKFVEGGVNADIGGGRFDNGTEALASRGVSNVVYDPFNRTVDHNNSAIEQIAGGKADTATVNNVLNVIREDGPRSRVIAQAADAVKQDGEAYFLIYEGDRSGVGKVTKKGFQHNRRAEDFATELSQHFGSVTRHRNMLIAKDPKKSISGPEMAGTPGRGQGKRSYTGEYWLHERGSDYADGDMGDFNHESLSAFEAQRRIADDLGMEDFDPYEHNFAELIGNPEYEDVIKTDIDPDLIKVALQSGDSDPRLYAVREWGWTRMQGNNLETWGLTQSKLKDIASNLPDEGIEDLSRDVFDIYDQKTGKFYEGVPFDVIESGDMKSLRDYGDNARGSPKASRTPGPDEAVSPVATSPLGGNAVVPKNQWQRLEDLGISDKHIDNWTKDDIEKILGGGFEQISENHLKLGGFLDQLVKGHAMTREDANIVKLVYAQSNAQYLPEMVKAHRSVIKSQRGKKYTDAAGLAEFWPSKPDYIQAKSKVHMISSGRIEPARVLIHELAHIVWYEANHGKNIHHQNLVTEFRAISKNQGTENFRDWFKSSGDRNPDYHAGRTKDAGPDPSVEQFAEFMSRSLLDRKIPPGAVGGAFTKAMSWLRDMLTRLKSAVGLDDKTRKRLDQIVDELGGFDNSAQMAPVPAPGAKPPAPPSVPRKAPPPLSVPGPPVMIGPPSKNSYPAAPSNPKPLGPLTETEAAKIFGEMLYAYGVIGKFDSQATSVAGVASSGTGPGSLREFLGGVQRPDNPAINAKRVAQKAAGVHPDTNWNLLNARGVDGRTESSFGLLAAGEEIGHFVEGLNRVAPFLNLLKKGYSPEEAAKRVGAAQILYSNKNFTPFEQAYMTRLFPFYKFTSRVAPYIMKQLMEHPGGAYAQAVRAQKNAQDAGDIAPDYVRETASIPVKEGTMLGGLLGTPPEGTDRYITGLGLMHEDPFSFGPNAKGAGLEMLSRMNPLIKGPLEAATGQSFFQKGVDGGRRLDDLDPLLGRLASNLGQNVGLIPPGPTDPEKFPGWLEQAAANSPFTRALSSARILSDPRKGWAAALTPLLTGVRLTDVSPGSKDALIRDLLQRAEKDAGASVFERVYFSDEDKAKMSKSEREEAEKLEALANVLAQRAKDRKKEKQSQTGR